MLVSLAILAMIFIAPMMVLRAIGGGSGSGGGGVGSSIVMLFQISSQVTGRLLRLAWALSVVVGEIVVGVVQWSTAQLVRHGSMALRRAAARVDDSRPRR